MTFALYPSAMVALLLGLGIALASAQQQTDGDDQFQVFHEDISRISATGNSQGASQQAPRTLLRPIAAEPEPEVTPTPPRRAVIVSQPVQRQSRVPARQPVRLVHISRLQAPATPPPETHFRAPLPASPERAPTATSPLMEQPPIAPLATPNFEGPALASFRNVGVAAPAPALAPAPASASDDTSVSPQHSALIAQVAAERQAEAYAQPEVAAAPQASSQPLQHHSLAAPLEALSSPSASQVQPPPTLFGGAGGHAHAHAHAAAALPAPEQQAASSPALSNHFVNQPEEPIVAPSFEHILRHGCPGRGVFSYENKDHCDRYYMCTNGTFTEEACPNGLAYGQMGAVYQHCAYNWNVDCGNKKTALPLASPGCPWQFGIFPVSSAAQCSIDYFVCEWGVPETKRCHPEGLFYDDRIKGCQWADQLGCKSEALLNFKCPPEDEDNPFWPYPRYYHSQRDVIVCVNEQPRLVHCTDEQTVEPSSLACVDLKKKKKKF